MNQEQIDTFLDWLAAAQTEEAARKLLGHAEADLKCRDLAIIHPLLTQLSERLCDSLGLARVGEEMGR